ncbi:MAG: bifunctional folylpolyglutamate synthase/dihydrofolate synthase [Chitinispirillaceae bacterium]|nr:bifunctional folylpolyglutamate synthase/dihydrofolate synthase [Chitinispirillaceae bacterium]
MEYSSEEIKKKLFSLNSRGIKYNLDRIRKAVDFIGNPQNSYPSIHVAGTNGKGSTCAFIESILRAAGYKTALFTSPHIVDFRERFTISGNLVTEQEWIEVYKDVSNLIDSFNLTFFEATMLIASELFKRHKVEYAVFETGMGGRLDATNILKPQVTVITPIAMDHMEYLGNTITEIAKEKLGIVKEKVPLVMALPEKEAVKKIAEEKCIEMGSTCFFVEEEKATIISDDISGLSFVYNGYKYNTTMIGKHQLINALLAIEAIKKSGLNLKEEIIQKGIATMYLDGRFQVVKMENKTLIFDVGHNPHSSYFLCKSLKKYFENEPLCFLVGIMKDKDYREMIRHYSEVANHIIFATPKTSRAAPAETLAVNILDERKKSICDSVAEAFKKAMKREERVICITGSFYTVGEVMGTIKNNPAGIN